jgi:hypothetical protein
MKTLALTLLLTAGLMVAGSQAFAQTTNRAKTPRTLKVVMHDPGCHSFLLGGRFKTAATLTGPVKVANLDEATLIVTGHGATTKIPVGKTTLVSRGHYVITMVGQAPDDNHLKLTVN